jgi:hypothetical protein
MSRSYINPVDFFNTHATLKDVFPSKGFSINGNHVKCYKTSSEYVLRDDGKIEGASDVYSKFELFTKIQMNSNPRLAWNWVETKLMEKELPFVRVGVDYYHLVDDINHFKVKYKKLVPWNKSTIIDDYGKEILKEVSSFSKFCLVPDNINYQRVHNNMYNKYAPFPHQPIEGPATLEDFKHIHKLMTHIFGEQINYGYTYLKVLYEEPTQILPVLVLTSKERETGKTSFLHLLNIIFGENFSIISPEELASDFNESYAAANIIAIDETVIEKTSVVEKIKSIATAKMINMNIKHVSPVQIPFYGKVVLATNKEKDFMRIDKEEIRFWVRKVPKIKDIITDIEKKILSEIPAFLRYLSDVIEPVDYTRSRMVFTDKELSNQEVNEVKKESRSSLAKDLEIMIEEYFLRFEGVKMFEASASDIKIKWFVNDNINRHYISKVLKEEMNIPFSGEVKRYEPFNSGESITGRVFTFHRSSFLPDDLS